MEKSTTPTLKKWFGKKGFSLKRVRELFMTGKDVKAAASEPVRAVVNLSPYASPTLLSALHGAFLSQTKNGLIHVESILPRRRLHINSRADFAIVLASEDEALEKGAVQAATAWMRAGVPTAVIGSSQTILVSIKASVDLSLARSGVFGDATSTVLKTICTTSKKDLLSQLAKWLLSISQKDLALGANWPFMRQAVCRKIILNASLANLAAGGIDIIPGADFPFMALTQSQMAMKIAAVYGYEINFDRIPEFLFIALSGLVMRGISKGLTSPMKHGKFLVKGAIGFAGTWTVGEALIQRFENGQTIDEVLDDMGQNSKVALAKISETVSTKWGELTGALLEIEPGAIYKAF